jgi:hypothetical protein
MNPDGHQPSTTDRQPASLTGQAWGRRPERAACGRKVARFSASVGRVESIEIGRIGPEDWQEFCVVRLAALRNAPGAFGRRTTTGWTRPRTAGASGWSTCPSPSSRAGTRSNVRAGFTDLGVPDDWPTGAPRERRMRHDG